MVSTGNSFRQLDLDARATGDDQSRVSGHDLECLAEFAREEVGNLRRVLDEVEVPTPLGREPRHQYLVEVRAHTEGGRGDALRAEGRRVTSQHVGIGLALIGLAVREQQNAAQRRVRLSVGRLGTRRDRRQLPGTPQPAAAEVRAAARVDRLQSRERELLRLRRGRRRPEEGVDLRVVADDRETVALVQESYRVIDRLLRHLDLPARHRPGSVEHERRVHRRAFVAPRTLGRGDGHGEESHGGLASRKQRSISCNVHE